MINNGYYHLFYGGPWYMPLVVGTITKNLDRLADITEFSVCTCKSINFFEARRLYMKGERKLKYLQ